MTAGDLAVVVGVVFGAALVQVVSGFGFSLLALPLMSLAIPTRDAVVVATLLGISLSGWLAVHGRADTDWRLVRRITLAAYAGMPLGLWVFVSVGDDVLRLILGVSVLVAVVLLGTGVNLRHSGPALDVGAGFLSGVLNTSISTNGPPLVFVLQARHLQPQPFRSTITTVFALSSILSVTLFVAAGKVDRHGLVAAAAALPAVAAGQLAGLPLRRHVHGERFRSVVLALLVVAAASAIFAAIDS